MKYVSRFILKLMRWKANCTVSFLQKSVICIAPHTSNWDFLIGMLLYASIGGRKPHFFMKKELFVFPLGLLFKAMGGIAVDRKHKSSLTDKITEQLNRHRHYNICVTPEGTRKAVGEWKKGFYYIALKAGVPIQLAYIDYAKREGGITKILVPSGDEARDFAEIQAYYEGVTPRFPERFGRIIG